MISQLFMLKSALFSLQRRMQIISNNVSNAQTPGFKRSEALFESMFPLIISNINSEDDNLPTGPNRRVRKYVEYGQGVRIATVQKDLSPGTLEITNQELDLATEGQGYFQVRLPDGRTAYTRAGNFGLDNEGNVVSPNGHFMEPSLTIPQNTSDVIISEEGRVFVQVSDEAEPQEIGQVVMARFRNGQGLHHIGQNLYIETAASGQPEIGVPGQDGMGAIRQGALEFSNVNIVEEMFDMLLTQRNFEVITKAIKAGDDVLKAGSDMAK